MARIPKPKREIQLDPVPKAELRASGLGMSSRRGAGAVKIKAQPLPDVGGENIRPVGLQANVSPMQQSLNAGGQLVARMHQKALDDADQMAVLEYVQGHNNWHTNFIAHPDTGLDSYKGKKSLDAQDFFLGEYDDFTSKQAENVPNRVKLKYKVYAESFRSRLSNGIATHTAKQLAVYKAETYNNTAASFVQNAKEATTPEDIAVNLMNLDTLVQSRNRDLGLVDRDNPEVFLNANEKEMTGFRTEIFSSVIKQKLVSNQPEEAEKLLNRVSSSIQAEEATKLRAAVTIGVDQKNLYSDALELTQNLAVESYNVEALLTSVQVVGEGKSEKYKESLKAKVVSIMSAREKTFRMNQNGNLNEVFDFWLDADKKNIPAADVSSLPAFQNLSAKNKYSVLRQFERAATEKAQAKQFRQTVIYADFKTEHWGDVKKKWHDRETGDEFQDDVKLMFKSGELNQSQYNAILAKVDPRKGKDIDALEDEVKILEKAGIFDKSSKIMNERGAENFMRGLTDYAMQHPDEDIRAVGQARIDELRRTTWGKVWEAFKDWRDGGVGGELVRPEEEITTTNYTDIYNTRYEEIWGVSADLSATPMPSLKRMRNNAMAEGMSIDEMITKMINHQREESMKRR